MIAAADAPVLQECRVIGCRRSGEYVRLALASEEIARRVEPGQFVELAMDPRDRSILRRPFSVYRADASRARVEIVFDAIGPGTRWLSSLRAGRAVGTLGPLGRGFSALDGLGAALLVGGGYGAAPLYFLAERLRAAGTRVGMVLGAARRGRVLDPREARRLADEVRFTTVDGSLGIRGVVTDAMAEAAAAAGAERVYACGPMPMLEAVSKEAQRLGLACEIAVEEFMACGIGVCWTCVIRIRGNGSTEMRRSCIDGPVFDGAEVAWE